MKCKKSLLWYLMKNFGKSITIMDQALTDHDFWISYKHIAVGSYYIFNSEKGTSEDSLWQKKKHVWQTDGDSWNQRNENSARLSD